MVINKNGDRFITIKSYLRTLSADWMKIFGNIKQNHYDELYHHFVEY